MTAPPTRWPLHPPPGPLESLSSWLDRLAMLYAMTTKDLIGPDNAEFAPHPVHHLDVNPPPTVLATLTQRTGLAVDRLQAMTLAGWVPCLFDQLPPMYPSDAVRTFYNYCYNPVILPFGDAGGLGDGFLRRWAAPWWPAKPLARRCPVCATDPDRGCDLVWRLPLVFGCGEHGCYLEDLVQVDYRTLLRDPMPPRPVPEPLATLERYTYAALMTGHVDLPGRPVQAAVWFRLLRSLLHEVSLAISTRRASSQVALKKIWTITGLPPRAGLNVWTPYEQMPLLQQHDLMTAAAAALQLAADGVITARGRLATAIQPPPDQYVFDGDRPNHTAWHDALDQTEQLLVSARRNATVAATLLACLTINCRTLTCYEEHRSYLFGAGVPARFLPTVQAVDRTDLIT